MARIISFLLFTAIFFGAQPASAGPAVDQFCTIESTPSDAIGIDLTESSGYQTFSPTRNTLESVELILGTFSPNDAKAKVKISKYSPASPLSPSTITVVAEKFISVRADGDGFYTINFDDTPLPAGIYLLSVEAVHSNEKVYWLATSGLCYPGGYAVISGIIRDDLDFFFSVMTYDSPVRSEESTLGTAPEESVPADDTSVDSSSSTSATSSSQSDQSTTTGTSNATSAETPKDFPAGAKKISTESIEGKPSGDTTNANQSNAYTDKLMADKELQETIAFILNDIEKNKSKGGAFGLKGRVGELLTWPVFYTICGIAALLVLLKIIGFIRKRSKKSNSEQAPVPQSDPKN